MNIFAGVIILAVIQGLGEFLPISATGHSTVVHAFLPSLSQYSSSVILDIVLHIGSLVAVMFVLRKTLAAMAKDLKPMLSLIFKGRFRLIKATKYQLMTVYTFIASLPLVICIFIGEWVYSAASSVFAVGILFIISAALMFIADHSVEGDKTFERIKPANALKVGLFRVASCAPGISSVAASLASSLNMGFTRDTAVEFTYLLSIPVIVVSTFFKLAGGGLVFESAMIVPYLIGFVISAVLSALSIKFVKYLAKQDGLFIFTLYCLASGIFAIIFSFVG